MKIKEVIVVEGRSDVVAVKRAVDAEVLVTSGAGLNERIMKQIEQAAARNGIIVLTDPDYPGERIREKITKRIPEAKHAFIAKEDATKEGDVGVENASVEAIREAIASARPEKQHPETIFDKMDLIYNDLEGSMNASQRRATLGKLLKIGYCNAKQLLSRLNRFEITREEFETAIAHLNEKEGKSC